MNERQQLVKEELKNLSGERLFRKQLLWISHRVRHLKTQEVIHLVVAAHETGFPSPVGSALRLPLDARL